MASGGAASPEKTEPVVEETPPGGWLKDSEGKEYRLEALEKKKFPFRRLEDGRVRVAFGLELQVDREDDEFLYYRVYRADPTAVGPTAGESAAIREAKAAEVRKQMAVKLVEVDQLQGVDFGRGLPSRGQWRNSFEFADMNGDGALDLVHGPSRKGTGRPNIFLGDGRGGWSWWAAAKFPQVLYDYGDASVGDFDGDGNRDIALAVHLRGLLVLLGDGKGVFRLAGEGLPFRLRLADPPGFSSRQVQAIDWDADGRDDLLAVGEGPRLAVAPSGDGSQESGSYGIRLYRSVRTEAGGLHWEWANPHDELGSFFGDELRLVDGRRSKRFVVGTARMSETALLFEGREEEAGWQRTQLPVPPRSYAFSAAPIPDEVPGVAVAGMTFDGGVTMRMIEVYRKQGSDWSRETVWSQEHRNRGPVRVAAGDLNGDGLADLVSLSADGEVVILLQEKGGWRLEASPELQGPAGCSGYGLELQDLDGDGRIEVAMSFAGEQSSLFDPLACPENGALRIWKIQSRKAG